MVASAPKTIRASVGLINGKQCYNRLDDLNVVFDLLNGIPAESGGLMVRGLSQLKPSFQAGTCPAILHKGILSFQSFNRAELAVDGHVDPGGKTIAKLNQQQPLAPLPNVAPAPPALPPVPKGTEGDQVAFHIRRALAAYSSEPEATRLWHATAMLTAERNATGTDGRPCNCGNRPLAYAEHYVIARAVVAAAGTFGPAIRGSGFSVATSLVLTYDLLKIGNAFIASLEREIKRIPMLGPYAAAYLDLARIAMVGWIFKQGICAGVSYPKAASTAWGLRGCYDGLFELRPGQLPVF